MEQDGRILTNPKEDLTGRVFGKLTVLRQGPDGIYKRKSGRIERRVTWICDCDCGNKNVIILHGGLISGWTRSCGCLRYKNKIQYDLNGEFGIGYKDGKELFYFDLEDYDVIKNYSWSKNKSGYIVAYVRGTGRKNSTHICMHRLVMNVLNIPVYDAVIDHINGITYDNRKSNLRITDMTHNNMNRVKQSNNSSGYPGVYYDKVLEKWFGRIELYDNIICLGYYDNINDAIKAREKAEEDYFGEYSYDNSRFKNKTEGV